MTNKKYKSLIFSDEMVDFIKGNSKGKTTQELTDLLNKKFKTNFKTSQVRTFKKNNHITSGLVTRFQKGHIPSNKGQKISREVYERCSKTMFKKGHTPHNHKPVGSTRIDTEGYHYTKTQEPNKWELTHRLLWEKYNGKIKRGDKNIFLDGNKLNIKIENLTCVKSSELLYLNRTEQISKIPELTKTSVAVAKLKTAIKERIKDLT